MKFSLRQIFGISFKFFRLNFAKMLPYTAIVFLFTEVVALIGYFASVSPVMQQMLQGTADGTAPTLTAAQESVFGMFAMATLILGVLSFIIMPKVYMAALIYVKCEFDGEGLSFGQAMRRTRGKFWRYVGNIILVAIISSIFTMVSVASNPVLDIAASVYSAAVGALLCLVVPLVAFENSRGVVIPRAIKLLAGFVPQAMLAVFMFTGLFSVIEAVLGDLFLKTDLSTLLFSTVMNLLTALALPLASAAQTLVYNRQTRDTYHESAPEPEPPQDQDTGWH